MSVAQGQALTPQHALTWYLVAALSACTSEVDQIRALTVLRVLFAVHVDAAIWVVQQDEVMPSVSVWCVSGGYGICGNFSCMWVAE